jgi:hypothetical protein
VYPHKKPSSSGEEKEAPAQKKAGVSAGHRASAQSRQVGRVKAVEIAPRMKSASTAAPLAVTLGAR